MAAKEQRQEKDEVSSSEEDEAAPAENFPCENTRAPALEEEAEEELPIALTASVNEVNGLDVSPQGDDLLPGWTTSGQRRIHQCSEHSPVRVADSGDPQERADFADLPIEDDPLPGWTTSGQRIHQCSEHSPVVRVADSGDPQGNADFADLPIEDDPLPGWTTSGQRIQQCSEHSPVGVADSGDPQEHADFADLPIFVFIIYIILLLY